MKGNRKIIQGGLNVDKPKDYKYEEGDELRYQGSPVIITQLLTDHRYLVCSHDEHTPFSAEVNEDELY